MDACGVIAGLWGKDCNGAGQGETFPRHCCFGYATSSYSAWVLAPVI